jgi:hypothetical protein
MLRFGHVEANARAHHLGEEIDVVIGFTDIVSRISWSTVKNFGRRYMVNRSQ